MKLNMKSNNNKVKFKLIKYEKQEINEKVYKATK